MNTDNKTLADYQQGFDGSLFKCRNFGEHMRVIIKQKDWDTNDFCMWTELNETMFSRIKQETYMPTKRIFATLCVAMELDMLTVIRLLQFTEINVLQKDELLQKYFYVMDNHRGKEIGHCNEILKSLGVKERDLLGSHYNKTK